MTIKERFEKIEFLKQYLPYADSWYKKLSGTQITAIYCKQINKNQNTHVQLMFDGFQIVDEPRKRLRKWK